MSEASIRLRVVVPSWLPLLVRGLAALAWCGARAGLRLPDRWHDALVARIGLLVVRHARWERVP